MHSKGLTYGVLPVFLLWMALAAQSAPAADAPLDRDAYVQRIEPICQRDSARSDRILSGLRGNVKRGRLERAGGQVIRSAGSFGRMVAGIVAVPPPLADAQRVRRWLGLLRAVERHWRAAGLALAAENRTRANHRAIRAERTANAANNAVIAFDLHHCRLRGSRLS